MADTVIIRVEKCTMTINLDPFFADSTLQNIKKLFVLIAKEPWNNEETIGLLLDYLTAMVEKSKQLFDEARATYADGYTDTDFQPEQELHTLMAILTQIFSRSLHRIKSGLLNERIRGYTTLL